MSSLAVNYLWYLQVLHARCIGAADTTHAHDYGKQNRKGIVIKHEMEKKISEKKQMP